jgi:hypothetical protein
MYQQRLETLSGDLTNNGEGDDHGSTQRRQHYRVLAKQLREAERAAILTLRARDEISEGVLRELEHELDLLDIRFADQ